MHLRRDVRKRWGGDRKGGKDSQHHTDRDEARGVQEDRERERDRNGRKRKRKEKEKREKRGEGGGRGRWRGRCERWVGFHVELQQRATDVSRHEAQER